MKEIELKKPLKAAGKQYKKLTYDTDNITVGMYNEAIRRSDRQDGSMGVSVEETDYVLHLYLGFAAIITANPEIDWADLAGITGFDIKQISDIGRNFILGQEESEEETSDAPVENIQDISTAPSKSSKKNG